MTDNDARTIAAQAWAKAKAEGDPDFAQCTETHKSNLAYKVQSVRETGALEDDFDRHVYAILRPEQAQLVIGHLQPQADAAPTAKLKPVAKAKPKKPKAAKAAVKTKSKK